MYHWLRFQHYALWPHLRHFLGHFYYLHDQSYLPLHDILRSRRFRGAIFSLLLGLYAVRQIYCGRFCFPAQRASFCCIRRLQRRECSSHGVEIEKFGFFTSIYVCFVLQGLTAKRILHEVLTQDFFIRRDTFKNNEMTLDIQQKSLYKYLSTF